MDKKVLMVMPHMTGGGAERVAAGLMNSLNEKGYDTRFVLTKAKKDEVVRIDLNEKTELILLSEELAQNTGLIRADYEAMRSLDFIFARISRVMTCSLFPMCRRISSPSFSMSSRGSSLSSVTVKVQ